MGIFDRFKSNRHAQDKARDVSDAAERKVNEKTGDKYGSRVDDAQQRMERQAGMERDKPDQP
ncbi:Rv0909 family putative TA system antitoxin [Streptomyces sp. NPDC056628]|uniref:Rv0909 family putative TA system antitoxin n=1 Tax=Streptomyces sp. NPDC056628 TaxID=3345882 RepID=UPI0036A42556